MLDKTAVEIVERRKSRRQDIGRHTLRLDPGEGQPIFNCFLWDISEGGARVQLEKDVPLPAEVSLVIGNVMHKARVVWRNGIQVGLEFLGLPQEI